jgi:adhesin transport system outer membrane protein
LSLLLMKTFVWCEFANNNMPGLLSGLLLSVTIFAAGMFPQTVFAQSLTEVIRQALISYPGAQAARSNAEGAEAEVDRAKAARWPVVTLGATGTQQDNIPRPWNASPQATYTVYAGGSIEAGVQRAEALLRAAEGKSGGTFDDVALQSAEAYLGWAKSMELARLADQNVKAHERILEDVKKIVAVDQGRRVDLQQAEVRVDAARLILTQREAEHAQARERLARYAGGIIPGRPEGLDAEPGTRPQKLEDAFLSAGDTHPLLAQAVAQTQAAEAAVIAARGQMHPKVDLSVSRPINQYTLDTGTLAQVSVNMPVFNGGALRAGVAAAQAQERTARHSLEESRLAIKERIATAWAEWQSAIQRERMSGVQKSGGAALVTGYREQFRLARRSLLDLLNVQNESFGYDTGAVSAEFDRRIARYRLSAAMGELARSYAR